MKYKILEGIARADVAYEVFGKTVEELFGNAAEAVSQTMVDLTTVKPLLSSKFKIPALPCLAGRQAAGRQSSKLDDLLLKFLDEILFYKDSRRMVFSKYQVKIADNFDLKAECWGEKIDPKRHKLRLDVKAVTRHKLNIKKAGNTYQAVIVLDI